MDRGAWWDYSPQGRRESDVTEVTEHAHTYLVLRFGISQLAKSGPKPGAGSHLTLNQAEVKGLNLSFSAFSHCSIKIRYPKTVLPDTS